MRMQSSDPHHLVEDLLMSPAYRTTRQTIAYHTAHGLPDMLVLLLGQSAASAGYGAPRARRLPRLGAAMRGRHLCFVLAFVLPALVAAVPSPGTAAAHQPTASSPPSTHVLRPHVVLMPTSKRPPLRTLSLWTPRTVRTHGIVTVIAQVNTPGAAVWLATRFGT